MVEEMRNFSNKFVCGEIDSNEFTMKCKELYSLIISDCIESMKLDNIILIPFIHEFAYYRYDVLELKEQVLNFLSILNGTQPYFYSTFLKLFPPDENKKNEFTLYCNFKNIEIKDLYSVFSKYIEKPLSIKDILNNYIFDILNRLDLKHIDESCFNYVNSNENISFSQIRDRIFLLLSYYLGINVLFIQISVLENNSIVYTIT